MTTEWVGESRPVATELAHPEVHADYTPTPVADSMRGVTIMERLDAATMQQLRELANGGCGNA